MRICGEAALGCDGFPNAKFRMGATLAQGTLDCTAQKLMTSEFQTIIFA